MVTEVFFSAYQSTYTCQRRLEKSCDPSYCRNSRFLCTIVTKLTKKEGQTKSVEGDFKEGVWLERIEKWDWIK